MFKHFKTYPENNAYEEDYKWFKIKYNNGAFTLKLKNYEGIDYTNFKTTVDKEYTVKGVDGSKVADIYVSMYGQEIELYRIFFLMEDGCVYWLEIHDAFSENMFNTSKLNDVSNIIKITNAVCGDKDSYLQHTTIGIIVEGNFYDLIQATNK